MRFERNIECFGRPVEGSGRRPMASEQRGERLPLVEPAILPDHPNWPNRPSLIGLAPCWLVLGLLSHYRRDPEGPLAAPFRWRAWISGYGDCSVSSIAA